MTPDRRLDQLEPLMADVLQKTDRLIEGQGQLMEVAVRADQNAETTARGVASLTVYVQQGFTDLRQDVAQNNVKIGEVDRKIDGLRDDMNQRFDQLTALIQKRLR